VIRLLPPTGLSVISDIDDTIKETTVTNRRELLQNTFLRDFKYVEGMADVYQNWHRAGAEFHYVSSSPWQLFESLSRLQADGGFPMGTMHLRNFRLRDQLFKKVLIIRRKGKASEIKRLLKNLPNRKFILVGDSGEKDPEIYRKILVRFPSQVEGVFIREVINRPLAKDQVRKLNKHAGNGVWAAFSTPEMLEKRAEDVISQLETLVKL
jgi:phosphatidate phosphatase APP1